MQISSKAEFELIPSNEALSFAVREFKLPAFESPWHFHPECELTYIVNGKGKRFVGDSIESFGPGEIVLLGSNLPHYWHNNETAKQQKDFAHSLVIQFREECLGLDFLSRPELSGVRRLLLQARRGFKCGEKTSKAMASIILLMKQHNGFEKIIDLLNIFRLFLEARDTQVLSSAGFSPHLDALAGERINRAYKYIFENFTGPLDHNKIARNAGMSHSAFCHYFKKVTGRTLTDFTNEVRIGHAKKLLLETDRTIAEIAYASGYGTLSNFNRCFQKNTGFSPKNYRTYSRP